jgi:hypothetical protein
VGATFALQLISLLVYVDIELSASLLVSLKAQISLGFLSAPRHDTVSCS